MRGLVRISTGKAIQYPSKMISRPKSLVSLGSRDITNFWPPHLHVEGPHPARKYPDSKV